MKIYQLWDADQQELIRPKLTKDKASVARLEPKQGLVEARSVDIQDIITKNLFDPKRGAGAEKVEVPAPDSRTLEGLTLLGTLIVGTDRSAIIRLPPPKRRDARGKRLRGRKNRAKGEFRRLRLGDTVNGYEIAEIHEQKVVFQKPNSTVEVVLNYSFRPEGGKKEMKSFTLARQPTKKREEKPTQARRSLTTGPSERQRSKQEAKAGKIERKAQAIDKKTERVRRRIDNFTKELKDIQVPNETGLSESQRENYGKRLEGKIASEQKKLERLERMRSELLQ